MKLKMEKAFVLGGLVAWLLFGGVARAQYSTETFEDWSGATAWGTYTNAAGWVVGEGKVCGVWHWSPPAAGVQAAWLQASAASTNSWLRTPRLPEGVGSVGFWCSSYRPGSVGTNVCALQRSADGIVWQTLSTFTNAGAAWGYRSVELETTAPTYLRWLKLGDSAADCYLGFDDVFVTSGYRREIGRRQLGPSSRRTMLTISEIMYHPAAAVGGAELEFVEVRNTDPVAVGVGGYRLSGAIDYRFPADAVIDGNSCVVVAADPVALAAAYGLTGVYGPFTNSLPNSGGTLRIRNSVDAVLWETDYSDAYPWPASADGAGHSLALARPDYGERDVRAWAAGARRGGSPGQADAWDLDPLPRTRINEFLAHTDLPQTDYVELFNPGPTRVDLSGCVITDNAETNKYVIPPGRVLEAGGFCVFHQAELGFSLSMHGDAVYLIDTNADRVLDAVAFDAQRNGVSTGRYPDGGDELRVLAAATPGASNAPPRLDDVVINELMYHPITADDDDEYIELHNRGDTTAELGHWRFIDGVAFVFPEGTRIPPGGFLVVARDAARLIAAYPQLTEANTLGNYSGSLSDRGERVVLARPDDDAFPEQDLVVVDTVEYSDGENWGRWSDGGGSSLELIDPHADNRRASNWASSDESAKAPWMDVAVTGAVEAALENISAGDVPSVSYNELHVYALQAGEYMLDDVLVRQSGGTTHAQDDFESGLGDWQLLGTHETSYLEPEAGFAGSAGLHIVATDPGDTCYDAAQRPPAYFNRVVKPLSPVAVVGPETVIRARVRWLRGYPWLLLCLKAYSLELSVPLTVPANMGTPGLPNSRRCANAGPAIEAVAHAPLLPAAGESVTISCRVTDADGVDAVRCHYRIDPEATVASLDMRDDGAGVDARAGDHIYSAALPPQPSGTLLAFYIEAVDRGSPAATNRVPDDAPARECLARYGETPDTGDFTTYRLWMTEANINEWTTRDEHNNTPLDGTLVYGNDRAVYNATGRYRGNWRDFSGPVTTDPCGFVLTVPRHERLLGASELKIDMPGQNAADATYQKEVVGYHIMDEVGLPNCRARYIRMRVNHRDKGILYDLLTPARDFAECWYPDDPDPLVWRVVHNKGLDVYTNVAGERKKPRYRSSWERRRTDVPSDDFSPIYALVDLVNLPDDEAYAANTAAAVDVSRWLGMVALNHVIVNTDAFGYSFRHNAFFYTPAAGRATPFIYDLDNGLASGDSTSSGLFSTSCPNTARMFGYLPFRRLYWRWLLELANGPMRSERVNAYMDAWYAVFTANGIFPTPPATVETWIANRRTYMLGQLASVDAPLAITSNGGDDFTSGASLVELTGTAPVTVDSFRFNGHAQAVRLTSETAWTTTVSLTNGANVINAEGRDRFGTAVGSDTITITCEAVPASPDGNIVINEIMYHPLAAAAEFVELHNLSENTAFDLGGLRLNGLDLTIAPGSVIAPRGYAVAAESLPVYAKTYGNAECVADVYAGSLDNGGETLRLWMPSTPSAPGAFAAQTAGATAWWRSIDRVRYDDSPPWPVEADGLGPSLQLIDAIRDNDRIGNWAAAPLYAPLTWQYVAVTGVTDAAATDSAGIFLYLSGAGAVAIDGLRLVAGGDPLAGTNLLVNGDFEQPLAGTWTLSGNHGGSVIADAPVFDGTGSLLIVATGEGNGEDGRFRQSVNQPVAGLAPNATYSACFWYYPTTGTLAVSANLTRSDLQVTAPTAYVPVPMIVSTPGASNNVAGTLPEFPPLWINEVMPSNVACVADNAGEFEPWVELYHDGTNVLELGGDYFLSNDAGHPLLWAFPGGRDIAPHGRLLTWTDGETNQTTAVFLHAAFRLNSVTGCVVLARRYGDRILVLDALDYNRIGRDFSFGSFPEGDPDTRIVLHDPTPGQPNSDTSQPTAIRINEWMADNIATLADPADNDFEDWFELFNAGAISVNLGGYCLSDKGTPAAAYTIPGGTILPAGAYLLVWADGESEQTVSGGALHADFKLDKAGESLTLFAPDGTVVDAVTFGPQQPDTSEGRWPDGAPNLYVMAPSTPGSTNRVLVIVALARETPAHATLAWHAQPGGVYRVDWCDSLTNAQWLPAGLVTAANVVVTLSDTNAVETQALPRYYRIARER